MIIMNYIVMDLEWNQASDEKTKLANELLFEIIEKYSLQGTTQSRYLTGGVPPVRFSM